MPTGNGLLAGRIGGVQTSAPTGVVKRFARFRDELPLILFWRESQFQDPISVVVADLAVFERRAQKRVTPSAGANNDFANATAGISNAIGVLWRESLVGMFVGGKDQICVRVVEVLPNRVKLRMTGVFREHAAAEKGVVSVGQNAGFRMGRQILMQPGFLRRTLAAAAEVFDRAICVQYDDVPGTEVVAVVPFFGPTSLVAPIAKIPGSR